MLTELQIRHLKPTGKRRVVSARDGTGLSIRVEASGKKTWLLRKAGAEKVLGAYPVVGLADARVLACETTSPRQLGALWKQWFAEEVLPVHKRPQNAMGLKLIWIPSGRAGWIRSNARNW